MAIAIKPLRRRRRTTQRGKSMSQSQRWGKVVTTMPVPGGEITTTEILVPVDPNLDLNQALVEADAEEATEEYDLPELS
jgi:hypothetical protein